jgi:hypothetical protein
MNWQFWKKKVMTIEDALRHERSDLKVSEWLQLAWNHHPEDRLPPEVLNAYLLDRFLTGVNFDGLAVYWENNPDAGERDVKALEKAGVHDVAELVRHGLAIRENEDELDALDQKIMAMSVRIQDATHQYIRDNLAAFNSVQAS